MINRMDFDLILLDVKMPGLTGYETARLIKGIPSKKDIPIIAMTAYGSDHDRRRSIEAGMDDHIVKPIDPEKFMETIKHYLRPKVSKIKTEADQRFLYLDIQKGLSQCLDDQETYEEILEYVVNHHAKDHLKLMTYYENHDYEQLLKLLHQFKSLSGNIGAGTLRAQVEAIETQIRNREAEFSDKESLMIIKDTFEHVLDEIRVYLKDPS